MTTADTYTSRLKIGVPHRALLTSHMKASSVHDLIMRAILAVRGIRNYNMCIFKYAEMRGQASVASCASTSIVDLDVNCCGQGQRHGMMHICIPQCHIVML